MKKLLYIIATALISLTGTALISAQTETVAMKSGDSLLIDLDGYRAGTINWQSSSDSITWTKIPMNSASTLKYKIVKPQFIRARVKEGTCGYYYSDVQIVNMEQTFNVSTNKAYVEPAGSGFTNSGGTITSWSNLNKSAVWYLYQKAGTYDLNIDIKATVSATARQLELSCAPCYDLGFDAVKDTLVYKGNNKRDTISGVRVVIPQTGYYRYELKPLASMTGVTIYPLSFYSFTKPGVETMPEVHGTDYLSSPSVHLSFSSTASTTKEYNWIYEEIMVPQGYDPLYTYWMSLGFFRGYMGIQTNSATERRVLFSVWDSVDTDTNPDASKDSLVSLVDKADYVTANGFGNEGTGGQSYVKTANWKVDQPVKFLMNVRRDAVKTLDGQGNVIKTKPTIILSAWYCVDETEGWKYVATWRAPFDSRMFDGFYSFIENFGNGNGQQVRKGYYYNAFAKEYATGKWVSLNKVGFSHTDGAVGQRVDYEQGVAPEYPERFYMASGGYTPTKLTANQIPLQTNAPTLDLAPFTARVDTALEAEAELNNIVYKDKTGWSIESFTTQETSGEGTNGRAAQIIDGNTSTYWHSAWTGTPATYPHQFVVDTKTSQLVKGFKFTLSGGTGRHMKDIKIDGSENGSTWTQLMRTDAPDSESYLLKLDAASTFRYFRLTIYSGWSTDIHTRINEVDLF